MHRLCAGSSSKADDECSQQMRLQAVPDSEGDTTALACFEGNVPAVETLLNFEQTDCTIRTSEARHQWI